MSGARAPSAAPAPASGRRVRWGWIVLGVVAACAAWLALDLYAPRRVDIRVFDPDEVARLDTAMWRSYYDRQPLPLFFQLAELMRRQFHFPLARSNVAAFHAARAAFTFKNGHGRADYQRAIPDLVAYYGAIRRLSTTSFDVRRTAELELEWWIVHRERLRRGEGDLDRALAEAAAALYRVPASALAEYGRERAEAMDIRDRGEAQGGVSAHGWASIERHLRTSWRALAAAVRPSVSAAR